MADWNSNPRMETTPYGDFLISVNGDWRDWRSAIVRLADLWEVHWRQPAGASHSLVHGYICCTDILGGGIPHLCPPGAGPHRLIVCVLKSRTLPAVYAELARRAGEQRTRAASGQPTAGGIALRWPPHVCPDNNAR
jgi:hypothetical protein